MATYTQSTRQRAIDRMPIADFDERRMWRNGTVICLLLIAIAGLAYALVREHRKNAGLRLQLIQGEAAAPVVRKSQATAELGKSAAAEAPEPGEYEKLVAQNAAREIVHRARSEVQEIYGPALRTLHLAPAEQQKLKELLAERAASTMDARDASESSGLKPEEMRVAVTAAEAEVDQRMKDQLGSAVYDQVKRVLDLSPELVNVRSYYSPYFAFGGHPLSDEQSVTIAEVLRDVYNLPAQQNGDIAGVLRYRTEGLDPKTGLSDADRKALEIAQRTLTPDQLSILRAKLGQTTKRYVVYQKSLR